MLSIGVPVIAIFISAFNLRNCCPCSDSGFFILWHSSAAIMFIFPELHNSTSLSVIGYLYSSTTVVLPLYLLVFVFPVFTLYRRLSIFVIMKYGRVSIFSKSSSLFSFEPIITLFFFFLAPKMWPVSEEWINISCSQFHFRPLTPQIIRQCSYLFFCLKLQAISITSFVLPSPCWSAKRNLSCVSA